MGKPGIVCKAIIGKGANMDLVVELANLINSNKEIVVANIGNDSVDIYDYIQKQFNNSDVASNIVFQKEYTL